MQTCNEIPWFVHDFHFKNEIPWFFHTWNFFYIFQGFPWYFQSVGTLSYLTQPTTTHLYKPRRIANGARYGWKKSNNISMEVHKRITCAMPGVPIHCWRPTIPLYDWQRGDWSDPGTWGLQCIKSCQQAPFQYKDCLFRYKDSHYNEEMVVRSSYLYSRNSYKGKKTDIFTMKWLPGLFPVMLLIMPAHNAWWSTPTLFLVSLLFFFNGQETTSMSYTDANNIEWQTIPHSLTRANNWQ